MNDDADDPRRVRFVMSDQEVGFSPDYRDGNLGFRVGRTLLTP